MATSNLEIFNTRKEKVQNLISESIKIYETLGMKTNAEKAGKSLEKVQKEDFKAIVIGEFKRGKSTFINALLGDEILPAFATPCTAVINEVKYADKEKAVLHFKDPLPQDADYSFKEEVKNHINRYGKTNIPPLPIDVKDLEEYVVIPDPAKDQRLSVSESPYSKVELFYPIEICKNGVTIIDSPGLNEHGTRTKVTTDYLSQVDAILFVMSCQALCSQTEMDFIENKIRGYGHEEIFFICNRFDEIREREKERVISYAKTKLAPLTSFGEAGIFFVSAADALDGRLDGKPELVEKSGMVPFEENLKNFFVNERGKIKLNQPMKELFKDLKDVHDKLIPGQIKMLDRSVADIEKKYEELLPTLKDAEKRRDQIIQKINIGRERIRQEVKDKSNLKMRYFADNVGSWLEEYEPENEVKFFSFKSTEAELLAVQEELWNYIGSRLDVETDEWLKNELMPAVSTHLDEIKNNIGDSLELFGQKINTLKNDIYSGFYDNGEEQPEGTANSEEAVEEEQAGTTAKDILTTIAWGGGGFLFGVLFPVVAGPASIALLVKSFFDTKALNKGAKTEVAKAWSSILRENAYQYGDETAAKVFDQTAVLVNTISDKLNEEINKITETVKSVLEEKKRGEAESRKRTQELEQLESAVKDKIEDIRELISEVNPNMKYSEVKNLKNI